MIDACDHNREKPVRLNHVLDSPGFGEFIGAAYWCPACGALYHHGEWERPLRTGRVEAMYAVLRRGAEQLTIRNFTPRGFRAALSSLLEKVERIDRDKAS